MAKIKITRYKGDNPAGTGKTKTLQVTLANKKGAKTLTRSVTKDAGKKITERSVVRNLRQGTSVKKTKEDGVKTKTYRAMVDRDGGKSYQGTDKQMFKGANKLNKVVEKRGRAADLQKKSLEKFSSMERLSAPPKMKEMKMDKINLRDLENIGSVPQNNSPKIKPMPPVKGYPQPDTSPAKPGAKQSKRIDNKIERLENRKQRIGSDKGMNKRQFERAGNIRKKIYDLNKKRNAS
jgi:hypothetical protein